jgi:protein-S-isoprenylcysteine O-methyltransferase Ste14
MAIASKDSSGVEFPPPAIYALWFGAGYLIERRWPWPFGADAAALRRAGVGLVVAGGVLAASAILTFWRARTTVLPIRTTTTIVARGPYRFTRNPMYVAMAVAHAGFALILNSVWPIVLLPAAMLCVQFFVIRLEERYLSRKFGESYEAYRRQVRRWF